MRPRELRPEENQSQTERDVYSPLTGAFSLWGAMNVNRIQPTVWRGQGRWRRERRGQGERTQDQGVTKPLDSSSPGSDPLWIMAFHKPFHSPVCLSENYSPFYLKSWLNINGRMGVGVHEDTCFSWPSFWNHWEKTFFSPALRNSVFSVTLTD